MPQSIAACTSVSSAGIDEAFFLGGITKRDVLKAFGAHIFFDDQLLGDWESMLMMRFPFLTATRS